VVNVPADPEPAPAPAPAAEKKPAGEAAPPAPAAPKGPPVVAKREIGAMNAGELAALDVAALSVDELEQAMRAAVKLDARDLAVAFAQAGVMKPFDATRPDRYPLFAVAITGAAAAGDATRAADLIDQGVKYDAEHNAGQRATDYGLRKAQLY